MSTKPPKIVVKRGDDFRLDMTVQDMNNDAAIASKAAMDAAQAAYDAALAADPQVPADITSTHATLVTAQAAFADSIVVDISAWTITSKLAWVGKLISTFTLDLGILEEIRKVGEQIKVELGAVDILINNAGVVTGTYFHEHSHEQIEFNMRINSLAPMHLTRAILPGMISQNRGSVCTIASSAALVSNPKMSVYAASIWAAVGWSDSVRLEMEKLKKNIHFTTIMPYYINTGMFDGVKSKLIPILDPEKTSEKIIRAIEKERKMLALPLPFWFIRLSQGILPLGLYDWVMEHIFGIYDTMTDFKGRKS